MLREFDVIRYSTQGYIISPMIRVGPVNLILFYFSCILVRYSISFSHYYKEVSKDKKKTPLVTKSAQRSSLYVYIYYIIIHAYHKLWHFALIIDIQDSCLVLTL